MPGGETCGAYEEETAGFQTGFAQRPAVVFAASSADDVAAAVAYGAAAGLPVGVQATGHGLPGAVEGGVLVSTRRMDGVRIDAGARTARIGAGARWGAVMEAAAPHGLAPLSGSAPGVGAVSYTLGGGLGLLGREFGYAADHVRSVDLVTADARRQRVTPESDPELFWGLLGGGHTLGVVTALEIGLVPVSRLYAGALAWDGGAVDPAAVLRAYEAWAATVPDTVTSSFAAVALPDLPMFPEAVRGRYVLSVRIMFTGGTAEGERLVAPLRAAGPVLSDSLREMPYTETGGVFTEPDVPHAYYGDSAVLRELDVPAVAELLALTGPGSPVMCVVQINHLGGALAKEPAAPNAVPHRDGRYLVRVLSGLAGTDVATVRAHYARVLAVVEPWTTGRSLNFAFGGADQGAEGLYGPDTRKRLAALKGLHDPANLFRRNYGV
ncbi:FAD-binding oxidoreductase [Streptomyces sp. NPDC091292]|uniref:FAD-binding oxidoreductase n=1 Tax=Streptomyces sp. NPDC091292 TaxID=3365991 RepID=UPI00382E8B73